jgi:hypothetical protein
MANVAAGDLDGLVRIIKRKLKRSSTGPPDRRLPDRHWPENRTRVTPYTTSSPWLSDMYV